VAHEDWSGEDPVGGPIEEVRRVRDDIEHRVRALLQRLEINTAARRELL
jgi:ArsR family transcriptional regulator